MQGSNRATRMPQQSVRRLGQAPISLTYLGFGWVCLRGLAPIDPTVARCRESIAFRNSLLGSWNDLQFAGGMHTIGQLTA